MFAAWGSALADVRDEISTIMNGQVKYPLTPDGNVGRPVVITAHLKQATFPDATNSRGT